MICYVTTTFLKCSAVWLHKNKTLPERSLCKYSKSASDISKYINRKWRDLLITATFAGQLVREPFWLHAKYVAAELCTVRLLERCWLII